MQSTVFFSNIKAEIISNLNKATKEIKVAVAWLIDEDIIRVLTQRKKAGVEIKIAISNSVENFQNNKKFKAYLHLQGQLFVATNKLLHHKFCIIDDKIIVNGSYNWTYQAVSNEENILVITLDNELKEDTSLLQKFIVKHDYLCNKCSVKVNDITTLNSFESNSKRMSLIMAEMDEKEIFLREDFENQVRKSFETARELKIPVSQTVFEKMISDGGGVEAVKRLLVAEINSGEMKSGFRKLEQHIPPRVDLSFEFIVSRPKFHCLFSKEEVEYCNKLMQKYGL